MKVFLYAAAAAVLVGVSNAEISIAPDGHVAAAPCDIGISDGERLVTPLGAAFCEMQNAMPYDSLGCLVSSIRISWKRKTEGEPARLDEEIREDDDLPTPDQSVA